MLAYIFTVTQFGFPLASLISYNAIHKWFVAHTHCQIVLQAWKWGLINERFNLEFNHWMEIPINLGVTALAICQSHDTWILWDHPGSEIKFHKCPFPMSCQPQQKPYNLIGKIIHYVVVRKSASTISLIQNKTITQTKSPTKTPINMTQPHNY